MSTFYNNIPQPGDDPTDSQPLLLSNFQAILNAQDRNHIDFSDTANSGRHDVVEMKEQSGDPTPLATYGSVYVKDDTGTQNLYMIDESSVKSQLTNNYLAATNGWAILPSKLLMQWGTQSAVLTGTPILFTTAFSGNAFNVQISEERDNNAVRSLWITQGSISATQFTIQTNDTSGRIVKWFAIGLAP